jgi:hypothetical protein
MRGESGVFRSPPQGHLRLMLSHLDPGFHVVDTVYQSITHCTRTIDNSTELSQFFCHVLNDDLTTWCIASAFGKKATEFLNCEPE